MTVHGGCGQVYWVGKNGSVFCQQLTERIGPRSKEFSEGKLLGRAGVLYMECRSLQKLPPQSKGVLCVVKLLNRHFHPPRRVYRLCIIWRLDPSTGTLQGISWKGAVATAGSHRLFPAYHELSRTDFFTSWKNHFEKISFQYEGHMEIQYLTQVYGPRPFEVHPSPAKVNPNDGLFEASFEGPDVLSLPNTASLGFQKMDPVCPIVGPPPHDCPDRLSNGANNRRRARKRQKRLEQNNTADIAPFLKRPNMKTFGEVLWREVYVEDGPGRLEGPEDQANTVAWPLLHQYISYLERGVEPGSVYFAILHYNQFKALVDCNGLYGPEEMDRIVQERCLRVVPLQCINNAGAGTRIRLVNTEELERHSQKGAARLYGSNRRCLSVGYDENPIHEGPGIVVSWWLVEKNLHPHTILPRTTDLLQDCYGKGFGSRPRSSNLGLNLYTGKRMSDMNNPSPVEGPGRGKDAQYFRLNYVSLLQPQLEKLINSLSTAASLFARRGDPTTNFFLSPKDKRTPCSVKIVTGGQSKAKNPWKQVLAFANCPHVDAFDEYDEKHQNAFIALLKVSLAKAWSLLHRDSTELAYANSSARYLQRVFDRVRFGTPCTCAYQHVIHPAWSGAVLYQFFMLDGMGHCVRLEHHIGHQFFAHTFVHRTSLCLVVFQGKVHFLSKDGMASMFAWGDGGNGSGARAPRRPRTRARRGGGDEGGGNDDEEKQDSNDEEAEEKEDGSNSHSDNESQEDSEEQEKEDEGKDESSASLDIYDPNPYVAPGEADTSADNAGTDPVTPPIVEVPLGGPPPVHDAEIHFTPQASSGGALSQTAASAVASLENPLFPFLSPPSFSPPISPIITNTTTEKAAQTTRISANAPIVSTKPPPLNAPVEGTEPPANAPVQSTEPPANPPVESTEPQHPEWDEAIAMAIDIHATATQFATAIAEAPPEGEAPEAAAPEAARNLMEDLNPAQDPIDLNPSLSPMEQLTPEEQLTPREESIPLQKITSGGSTVLDSLLQSVGIGTRSPPTQQETVDAGDEATTLTSQQQATAPLDRGGGKEETKEGPPAVSQALAKGGAVGVARGSSRGVTGEARASSGGAPGGVPGGFQFGGDAPIAQKKKKGTGPPGALKKPPPPPAKQPEPDIDLQQGNHHYFARNLMSLATNPVEQTRNFSAFGIPEDKYYLSENLGDGNCLFYVWMQFFHLLKAERKYSNISRRHISETIFLRKLVWDLAGEGLFKDNMLKKDDLVCYLLGGDAGTTTEEGVIDQYRVSLQDDVWENLREAVYNKDLMYKDWEELKITWKPHPDFPKDALKFDPKFFSVLHDSLQPSACFVGPFFMEKYAHLHFRVIAFFLQVYRLGKEGEYPPPNEIYLHIMDARDGPPVKYSVIHNGQFDPTMDDGRTLFMFVDTQHVNSMYRKTDAWQIEEYHRKEAEQSASLRKEARKKKRADRPT
jgi:hypothetical protein